MEEMELKNDEFYIVAVKDELTGKFMNPTFGEDLEGLKRLFTFQINTNLLWKHNASDYSFYKLGVFSQKSGYIIPDIEKICSGNSVVKED